MAAFWAPKQVDIVRDTLQGLHRAFKKTRYVEGSVQICAAAWAMMLYQAFLCAKKYQKPGVVVIDRLYQDGHLQVVVSAWDTMPGLPTRKNVQGFS